MNFSGYTKTCKGNKKLLIIHPAIMVHLNKYSMEWFIENKSMDKHSVAASKTYGTSRMDAYSIFEAYVLILKTVTVKDRVDDGDGKYHYVVNKNETMLAREKQNLIKEKFKEWIFAEPERRKKYVDYYNRDIQQYQDFVNMTVQVTDFSWNESGD